MANKEGESVTGDILKQTQSKGAEILYVAVPGSETIDLTHSVEFDRLITDDGREHIVYIRYPHQSAKLSYTYEADAKNPWLREAKLMWEDEEVAKERIHPTAAIVLDDGQEISRAGNGKFLEYVEDCERKKLGVPTGTGYHLCKGNHASENHAEYKANGMVIDQNLNPENHDLTTVLYGHWWACEPCCSNMEKAGTKTLIMSKDWTRQFLGIDD